MTTTAIFVPASPKQISFVSTLLKERVTDADHLATLSSKVANGALSKAEASDSIGWLLSCPKKHVAPKVTVSVNPGFYFEQSSETVYEVVSAKTGNLYAKKMVPPIMGKKKGSFEYAPGAIKHASHWVPLTLAEAAALGKKWGVCCVCGRTLTQAESVAAGIGPVCAGKL